MERQILAIMSKGASVLYKQVIISTEQNDLHKLHESSGSEFPGSDYYPTDRQNWMSGLGRDKLQLNQIVWPGTHNSATNQIGCHLARPYTECQCLSIYDQLRIGTRLLDIRVQKDGRVCNEMILSYSINEVINDIKKFLSETQSEIIILEIRTEFNHQDPPEFEKYLEEKLGKDLLIDHDDRVFEKTIAEVLPKRIICIWKPRNSAKPQAGGSLWSSEYIRDDWISTDLPLTKFNNNLKLLGEQPPVTARKFFYRVENTLTPQADNPWELRVKDLTMRIHRFATLFIAQCFSRGFADRLQVLSTDFIDEDFVDACVGLTYARVEGKA